jgi:Lon protease-like protein
MNEDQQSLDEFNGVTRLFPLPNLVFFPQVVQPLHIFEPRYREMIADSLAADRLISLVLLQPGWEKQYDENPPIHSVACLGRIIADQLLPDGRYNLLLRGLSRVRIVEELPMEKTYRTARVELLSSQSDLPINELAELRKQLSERLLPSFGDSKFARKMAELFQSELSLGSVCDVLSFFLPMPVEWKQSLLEQLGGGQRCRMLLEGIGMLKPAKVQRNPNGKFPPDFSSN